MKKSFDYFACLEQQSALILRLCRGGEPAPQALAKKCGALHRRLAKAALEDFLPPLDRGDLLRMSQALEGLAWEAAANAVPEKNEARAQALHRAVRQLPGLKKNAGELLKLAWEIKALAREGGTAALPGRFAEVADALECAAVKNV